MDFFTHNLKVLHKVAGPEAVDSLNISKVRELYESLPPYALSNLQDLVDNPDSYYIVSDLMPRSSELVSQYREIGSMYSKRYKEIGIKAYINDEEADPHLMQSLSTLVDNSTKLGVDISIKETTNRFQIDHIILFGADCGMILVDAVQRINPSQITLVVDSWESLAASFFKVDLVNIWNTYVSDPLKTISIIQVENSSGAEVFLFQLNPLSLDHALIYSSKNLGDKLYKISCDFKRNNTISRQAVYLGFVMDEYNMIYNSARTLASQPKIFRAPIKYRPDLFPLNNFKAIVCGSGPSLNKSIEQISVLSSTHVIISCASSLGTLVNAGIFPDILCILERGEFMVDQYKDVVNKIPINSRPLLIMSSTSPSGLLDLFPDALVYFRSALTPLSIFGLRSDQVLPMEGPQTINTGATIAAEFGFKEIVLFGVDLGTTDRAIPRSLNAVGESPRIFENEVEGNLSPKVFTNPLLLDGKIVLEALAKVKLKEDINLINCSDGVLIEGWSPFKPSEYTDLQSEKIGQDIKPEVINNIRMYLDALPCYSLSLLDATWKTMRLRESAYITSQQLIQAISSIPSFSAGSLKPVVDLLDINKVGKRDQFLRKIIRGQLYKLLISMKRQDMLIQSYQPELRISFLSICKDLLVQNVHQITTEVFSLLDSIDG